MYWGTENECDLNRQHMGISVISVWKVGKLDFVEKTDIIDSLSDCKLVGGYHEEIVVG